jgi:transcriptional regulator of arginine metabolism
VAITESQARLNALRRLLTQEKLSTQDELREELGSLDFEVTQSTISRDLRRIGAVKATDVSGRTVYRMPSDIEAPAPSATRLVDMITDIRDNGALIVIRTTPGSASLVARHIDQSRFTKVLGTIAGDDTVFVAPANVKHLTQTLAQIHDSLS